MCEELRLSVYILENKRGVNNGKTPMPAFLPRVNVGMVETGNTPVAAELCSVV